MEIIINALKAEQTRLMAELDRVQQMMQLAEGIGAPVIPSVIPSVVPSDAPRRGRPRKTPGMTPVVKRKGKRGQMKEAIVEAMQAVGAEGTTLKALGDQLNMPSVKLGQWMATTGKKVPQIKNIGRGTYAWIEKSGR